MANIIRQKGGARYSVLHCPALREGLFFTGAPLTRRSVGVLTLHCCCIKHQRPCEVAQNLKKFTMDRIMISHYRQRKKKVSNKSAWMVHPCIYNTRFLLHSGLQGAWIIVFQLITFIFRMYFPRDSSCAVFDSRREAQTDASSTFFPLQPNVSLWVPQAQF